MQCRIITLDNIKQETNLINSSQTATFFQTFEWLSLWTKHFANNKLVIGVYENEQLIGIAPLNLNEKEITFLGVDSVLDQELVTDYGDIIAQKGKEKEIWQSVIYFLKKEYSNFDLNLNFVRETSTSVVVLRELGGNTQEADRAPFIDLPKSWDDYLSSLDRHNRHELKRKIRKLESEKSFKVCYEDDPEDIDEFFRLMALSNEQKRNFLSEEMKKFFIDVFSRLYPQKKLELCFLKIEGKNVACGLTFFYQNEILLYNSGFDPNYGYLSPGFILNAYLIKQAIENRRKIFDFLRGAERYKYDLGAKPKKLYKVTLKL